MKGLCDVGTGSHTGLSATAGNSTVPMLLSVGRSSSLLPANAYQAPWAAVADVLPPAGVSTRRWG
jgi:hypothetical protein